MRFCVECNALTDDSGKSVESSDPDRIRHLFLDAEDASAAIVAAARSEQADIPKRIHHVDEVQAIATVRSGKRAMMLHAFPEEEAAWRFRGQGSGT
jgi:hypothetical protein